MRRSVMILVVAAFVPWAPLTVAAEQPLVILVPGGKGAPQQDGFLMRNKQRFDEAGFQTVVSTTPPEIVQAAKTSRAKGQKAFVVGMSIGVIKSAAALGAGAQVDGAVFFSGNYKKARDHLGSPGNLPPTLLVHHRHDKCDGTTPRNVEPFGEWSGGKVERVVWIQSSGNNRGAPPCGVFGAHGFYRKDAEPISAAIDFIKSH